MRAKLLSGITHKGPRGFANPAPHCPLRLQNRLDLEVVGPNEHGEIVTKQRVEHEGNVLASYGLDKLVSGLAGGTPGANFIWVSAMALGTGTNVPASTETGLVASTASVSWGAGAITASRSGARTLNYQATFSGAQAGTLAEIGIFESNNVTTQMVARQTFATVAKASNDTVNCTYKIIAATA